MESDLRQQHHQFQSPQHQLPQRQQQQMSSSGLMRYRSAPSSYFANFLDDSESYLGTARPSSPETERIIARFMSEDSSAPPEELGEVRENSHSRATETQEFRPELIGSPPPVMYQSSSSRPPLPNHSSKAAVSGPEMDRSPYTAMASVAQTKMGAANTSNLVRHSSSPAGFFSNLNVENGYVTIRGMGNMGSMGSSKGEACFSSANRLKGEINFSSGPPPPPPAGLMNHMSDIGNKSLGATSPEKGTYGKEGLTGFPVGSWEDSHTENYTGLKRAREDDRKIYSGLNASEIQHGGGPSVMLSRHMSLPKTSAEMASVEKYLQFQDSVPCKIRAKRGCATHPRSIAERVRRTRISERMRKLQELVPNMDKQTSNAEMLDLAVDYIKDLQKQLKTLSENRAKCTCSNNRKP